MEGVLLKSSQNIAELIQVIRLHEENIARVTSQLQEDVKMNPGTYYEGEYGTIMYPENITCLITREYFKPNDPVVVVRECNHIFKREPFFHWIKYHNNCPRCSAVLF